MTGDRDIIFMSSDSIEAKLMVLRGTERAME